MLLKSLFKCFVFLLVVSLQLGVPVVSQIQLPIPDVRPFKELTLEISTPTQILLPLQPIPLVLKQSNRTGKLALGYNSIGFDGYPVYLYARRRGNKEKLQIYPLTTMQGLTSIKNVAITPDTSFEAKEWITLHLNKYFSEPGIYELQAILANSDRTQTIESNIINVEIQEPTGTERNVYNLIKNSSFQEHLFSDFEFDKKKNILERIANQFSNSSYAQNAFFVLGERHFARRQYPQALVYFVRLENDNGFFFSEKVRKYLTEIRQSTQQ